MLMGPVPPWLLPGLTGPCFKGVATLAVLGSSSQPQLRTPLASEARTPFTNEPDLSVE